MILADTLKSASDREAHTTRAGANGPAGQVLA